MKSGLKYLLVLAIALTCRKPLIAQNQNMDSAMAAQKDLVDVLLKITGWEAKKENRGKNKLIFSIIPLSSTANGGKQVVVSSVNVAFYTGPSSSTKISNINFIPYTNFSSRSGFIITPNIWFSGNKWNANGELRIANNGIETYGLGANTSKENKDEVDFQYIRVYLNINRRIVGNFYLGAGYHLDYFYNVKDNWAHSGESPFAAYGIGTGSQTTSTGLTFNLLFDSRKNSINASDGFYSLFVLRANPPALNNDYSWSSFYFDNRLYFPLSSSWRSILAIWGIYWQTFGDVPYLNLPGSRLDFGGRTSRGYSPMRYCGKQMLYGEAEWRFDVSSNGLWGGVAFANLQSYTEPVSNKFEYVKPAIGIGLRVKFNKRSNTNVALDFAFGRNSFGWYLTLGEFF